MHHRINIKHHFKLIKMKNDDRSLYTLIREKQIFKETNKAKANFQTKMEMHDNFFSDMYNQAKLHLILNCF